jgi:Ca-activated chloride channel family protein
MDFARAGMAGQKGLNHLRIGMIPPEVRETARDRKPTLIVAVLDRSGSMQGRGSERSNASKMELTIESSLQFLYALNASDLFGVVTFDDENEITLPLEHLTQERKSQAARQLRGVYPRGSTDIGSAIRLAESMISADRVRRYNCKILVLSDGQANQGMTTPDEFRSLALGCLRRGVTVSAYGIGVDYDSRIMEAIAAGGGGIVRHIEDPERIRAEFMNELDLSRAITAKDVVLRVRLVSRILFGHNLGNFSQTETASEIAVRIGDLYAETSVFFELESMGVPSGEVEFAVSAEYEDVDGNRKFVEVNARIPVLADEASCKGLAVDNELVEQVFELLGSDALRDMSWTREMNDIDGVNRKHKEKVGRLENLSEYYGVRNERIEDQVRNLEDVRVSYNLNNIDRNILKRNYAVSSENMKFRRNNVRKPDDPDGKNGKAKK